MVFCFVFATILPFVSSFLGLWFGRKLGSFGFFYLTLSHLGLSVLVYLGLVMKVLGEPNFFYKLTFFNWGFGYNYRFDFGLLFDSLSLVMVLLVVVIALFIQLYAFSYMSADPNLYKFIMYISVFCLSMMILILSPNLVQLFFGWELVGISSFLLITFWSTRLEAVRSGLKAIFFNKIGDVGFVIGMGVLLSIFHSVEFDTIYSLVTIPEVQMLKINCLGMYVNVLECCMFGFLIAVMAKSAQFGLHNWLLDAMEGPTPVSALLHSATMVVAGIYLLLRLSPLLVLTPYVAMCLVIIGGVTCVLAGWCAVWAYDLKKIIAFSTCSQLGLMVSGCGMLVHTAVLNHVIQHAFFKAALFLLAGNIIHAFNNEQDIRKMGEVWRMLPVTTVLFLICSCALCGVPFFSGFYSKEGLLLEGGCSIFTGNLVECFGFVTCYLGSVLTLTYTVRLIYYTFFEEYRGGSDDNNVSISVMEPSWFMLGSCVVLSTFAVIGGYSFQVLFNSLYFNFFPQTLNIGYAAVLLDTEFCVRRHFIMAFLWLSMKQGFLVWLLWLGCLSLHRLVVKDQRVLIETFWRLEGYYEWPFKTIPGFELMWNLILVECRQFFSTQFYLATIYQNFVKNFHEMCFFILRDIEKGVFEHSFIFRNYLYKRLLVLISFAKIRNFELGKLIFSVVVTFLGFFAVGCVAVIIYNTAKNGI